MDPGCGKCLSSDCTGKPGYTDPNCPIHGKQEEPKSFLVTFTDKLERVGIGYSPGGAVFSLEMVMKFDQKKNTLLLIPCTIKKDSLYWFKFQYIYITVHPSKIQSIKAV